MTSLQKNCRSKTDGAWSSEGPTITTRTFQKLPVEPVPRDHARQSKKDLGPEVEGVSQLGFSSYILILTSRTEW